MERNKHIHEQAKPVDEEKVITVRKERKDKEPKQQGEVEAPELAFEGTDKAVSQPTFTPPEEPKKHRFNLFKKRKKKVHKHRLLRKIGKILIVILVLAFAAFFIGKVQAENDQSIPQLSQETFSGSKAANGAHNILILGSDSREGETSRTDSIMVLQLDGPGKPKLISFMRDMFVTIPGVGDEKLNAAYAYGGADLVRQTLADSFGIECQYYMTVDFQSFEKVIDAMFPRGVKIDAEKDMSSHLEVAISQGEQRMDGLTLLQYARFRMDEEGDFGRVRRQQQVMNAIFSQMKNPTTLVSLPYAAGKAIGYSSTNLKSSFLFFNAWRILQASGGIERLTVPVDGSWDYGESSYAGSVLFVDEASNQQAIAAFLN